MGQKQERFAEALKKGEIGENLVKDFLEGRGWIVYSPTEGKAHAFDKLCIKDKKNIAIVEIKTKARMNNLNATGFETRHLNEYKYILDKYGIDIFIFWVDEFLQCVYGNTLTELLKEYKAKDGNYPRQLCDGKITIFSLEKMNKYFSLEEDICNDLKSFTLRTYDYNIKE